MKPNLILIIIVSLLFSVLDSFAKGSVHVRGYTRKNGTYVAPHYRSAPNSTKSDNWSTKGNVNPYTGSRGTKNVTPSYSTPRGTSSETYIQPTPVNPTPIRTPQTVAPKTNSPALPVTRSTEKSALEMHYDRSDPVLESQKQNAAKGMPESQYVLGMRYLDGIGVEKDEAKGKELLKKAADQGHAKSRLKLKEIEKVSKPK